MNVKLRVLTAGVLFFTGQVVFAQKDTTSSKKDKEQKIQKRIYSLPYHHLLGQSWVVHLCCYQVVSSPCRIPF
jgi:hypothetical protein